VNVASHPTHSPCDRQTGVSLAMGAVSTSSCSAGSLTGGPGLPRSSKSALPQNRSSKFHADKGGPRSARSFLDDQRPGTTQNPEGMRVLHIRFVVVCDGHTSAKPALPSFLKACVHSCRMHCLIR